MQRKWDPRLDEMGVRLESPEKAEYRLVEARWLDPSEANDKHHIYVRVLNEEGAPLEGQPFRITNGGVRIERTKSGGFDDFWGNYPMFATGTYTVEIPDATSDKISRLPSGVKGNPYANTCFYLAFQRGADGVQPEPEPKPDPDPKPEPNPTPVPPKLDEATRTRLLKLLDQAQAELDAARKLLEG